MEFNNLIFRYLQESGMIHAGFGLECEAGIKKSSGDGNLTPPNALLYIIQKGLQCLKLEANLSKDDEEVAELLPSMDLITKNAEEIQKIIKDMKKNLSVGKDKEAVEDEIQPSKGRVIKEKAKRVKGLEEDEENAVKPKKLKIRFLGKELKLGSLEKRDVGRSNQEK